MQFTPEETRLRLGYINQHRERAIGTFLLFAASAWALRLGMPLAVPCLLAAWLALSLAFVRGSHRIATAGGMQRLAFGYFIVEVLLLTGMAHYCGGLMWISVLFYTVTILYANVVLPGRQGLWISVFCGVCFSALAVAEDRHWMPHRQLFHPHPRFDNPVYVIATLLAGVGGGFSLLALTSHRITDMLNRKAGALEAANAELKQNAAELLTHRVNLEDQVRRRTRDLEAATRELRNANLELQRTNQIKSNFLANVSHELRTPLTSIRSFSEILLRYPDEDLFTRAEFLEIIVSETDRLTRLINDVLDLAKIEAGRMDWRLQPVRLRDAVQNAVDLLQFPADQKGVQLANLVEAGLPTLEADPDRLQQVFTNLLANAVKFTLEGSIQIGSLRRGHELIIYVADTGAGIEAAELELIFEKFHQRGDSLVAKPQGTGLGLSICREILQHYGGRIWAESKPGCGATFFCAFPLASAASVEAPLAAAAAG